MIRTSVPLKLVIAGEWAVLDPSSSAIVAAVNHRLFCEIESNSRNEIEISLLDFGITEVSAKYENNELIFNQLLSPETKKYLKIIKFTIESSLFLLNYFKPFKIRIWSEKPENFSSHPEIKLELGSSAASVVAIHAAIRAFYDISIEKKKEKEKLLKLSLLSYFIVQNMKGSGIDIAAVFYGGILLYKRFDSDWVLNKIQTNLPLELFIEYKWPSLEIKPLPKLSDLQLLLGWTQKSSSTSLLISQMEVFKINNPSEYNEFISQISKLVKDLSKAWRKNNKNRVLADIQINEMYLRRLGEISGIPIEIPELKLLSHIADELGGAGKLSRGDLGIALCFDEEISNKILQEWKKYKIIGSKIAIDYDGLKVESTSKNE
ncbi:MAG: phosphomevalonate kinase [Promethearchaeota archaeon]